MLKKLIFLFSFLTPLDTLQTFIMLIGGVVLTFVSLNQVGGYSMLMQLYANSTAKIAFNSSSEEDYSTKLKCAQPAQVSWEGWVMSMIWFVNGYHEERNSSNKMAAR